MDFTVDFLNKNSDITGEIFLNIAKYSSGDLIITDEKFNIMFHNSKNAIKANNTTLFDIMENFLNDNIRITIENFKNSQNNHIFLKLIFNAENNFQNIPIDLHISKLKNKKGKIKGYIVIIHDITQEIRNRIQRETFTDILMHDLKNPIRANIQILELILNNKFGRIESNLKTILDELLNSCRFMNYMTDNLVMKYKNEFNLYELQKQKYSIVKLVKDRCNKLMNLLDRKKQTIELTIRGDYNEAEIDIDEMEKVINNLIINASEQSIENSIIKIKIENSKENINVSFTDYGYSKNLKNPNEIFEEYLTCSNKFRKVGFSLELYNCKKIIEAHNGRISAQNAENKGTSIIFSLPLCFSSAC